jgi:hypothetical protein
LNDISGKVPPRKVGSGELDRMFVADFLPELDVIIGNKPAFIVGPIASFTATSFELWPL